jgi:hypothetical protein
MYANVSENRAAAIFRAKIYKDEASMLLRKVGIEK